MIPFLRWGLTKKVLECNTVKGLFDPFSYPGPYHPRHTVVCLIATIVTRLQTVRQCNRPFQRTHNVSNRQLCRLPPEHIAAVGTANAFDDPCLSQFVQDLFQIRKGDLLAFDNLFHGQRPAAVVPCDLKERPHTIFSPRRELHFNVPRNCSDLTITNLTIFVKNLPESIAVAGRIAPLLSSQPVVWLECMEERMWIQMTVNTVLFDSKNSSYIVLLKDETGKKVLPIWIGAAEGNSIALALSDMKASRPLTHDLIASIFDRLEVEVARVVVSDLIDNTFYASLYLLQAGKEFHIDSRPSDAIAIAIRVKAPIFVQEEVLNKQDQATIDQWMKNLGEGGSTEYNA